MRVSIIGLLLVASWLGLQSYRIQQSWPGGIPPGLLPQTSERGLRIGLLGRPAELPLQAIRRIPEAAGLKIEFRTLSDPSQRWEMLAAGELDVVVASTDELALALPRFDPGVVVFPVAQGVGSDALVQVPGATQGPLLVAFPPGGASEHLAEYLARSQSEREARVVEARDPKQALEWLRSRQVQAAALYEPFVSQALAAGAQPVADTPKTPQWEVWVISRQALTGNSRVSREDLAALAQAWFNLVEQLNEAKAPTVKAIAEDNGMTAEACNQALKGTTFFNLDDLQSDVGLQGAIEDRLTRSLTSWSLFGAANHKGADYSRAVDLSLLTELKAPTSEGPGLPETTPVPEETPADSPTSSETPAVESTGTSDGSMLGVSLARNGVYPVKALNEVNSVAWKQGTGGDVATAVVLHKGRVLCGSDDGNVYSFDAARGDLQWKFPCGDKVRSTPAVADGVVYVGCNDARLYALKVETGEKLWSTPTDAAIFSSPAVTAGKVVFASMDGQVHCLEAETGKELWSQKSPGNVTSSPAIADGLVVFGCYDKRVYAMQLEDGALSWTFTAGGAVLATPCISDGMVYVGSQDRKFYALKLETGEKAWQFVAGDELDLSAAVDQGVVTFGGRDNQIYALDAATGKQKWKFDTRNRLCSDAVIADGVVYLGCEDKRLYALDLVTGAARFRHKAEGWVGTPAVADGTVYFGCTDHNVYALK